MLLAAHIKLCCPHPPPNVVGNDRIKLVIFDLDGVLVESRELHYEAMNRALSLTAGSQFEISRDEHLLIFDGLSTQQKLRLLTSMKGLPEALHASVWDKKQELTRELVSETVALDSNVRSAIVALKGAGFPVAVASNCIRESVAALLQAIGVFEIVDAFYSNGNEITLVLALRLELFAF